ncbi:MAG TPA: TIGR02391 family protein [Acidimicrobiales bacterium]|nr:TIGR02391 family protein [Acidimicrobiales bacterium]
MTHPTTPTAEELRELSTPELGLIILKSRRADLNANSVIQEHRQAHDLNQEPDVQRLLERLGDAWAWLVANALIGPHVNQDPNSGWCRITDRGRQVAEENSVTALMADQRLPDDLHPLLREAKRQFRAGNPELAVFEAMKQIEVRLRDLSGASNGEIGTKLARQALEPRSGPLADPRLEEAERQAISHLFAGALGAFKNPTSHRIVDFDDPALAADAVLLADLLMRMLDQAERRMCGDSAG